VIYVLLFNSKAMLSQG